MATVGALLPSPMPWHLTPRVLSRHGCRHPPAPPLPRSPCASPTSSAPITSSFAPAAPCRPSFSSPGLAGARGRGGSAAPTWNRLSPSSLQQLPRPYTIPSRAAPAHPARWGRGSQIRISFPSAAGPRRGARLPLPPRAPSLLRLSTHRRSTEGSFTPLPPRAHNNGAVCLHLRHRHQRGHCGRAPRLAAARAGPAQARPGAANPDGGVLGLVGLLGVLEHLAL